MEINGLITARGGKVHIHFGKQTTTNLWGTWLEITDLNLIVELKKCLSAADFLNVKNTYDSAIAQFSRPYIRNTQFMPTPPPAPRPTVTEQTNEKPDEKPGEETPVEKPDPSSPSVIKAFRIDAVGRLQKFFSEFKFTPAARFVNTLARSENVSDAKKYISSYVKLINNCDMNDIIEKCKSPEFEQIANDLLKYPPKNQINSRLDIYFGDAGTGKTTYAIKNNPEASVVPCNSSILPDELMRTFDFNDENGHPVFKPSVLQTAMKEGKTVIFDEINLLSFDCLRLLQILTDGKDEITYNNEKIEIKDGFKIIGTMNLTVNDQVYNLPEPLVDRCEEIKEFTLSTEQLADYAF